MFCALQLPVSDIWGCIQKFPDWQMVELSATKCSGGAMLWVSLVSFATISLYVASQRVIPNVSAYFVIDLVRKISDTPSYFLETPLSSEWVHEMELFSQIALRAHWPLTAASSLFTYTTCRKNSEGQMRFKQDITVLVLSREEKKMCFQNQGTSFLSSLSPSCHYLFLQ
jgi:hypothetical protein